MTDADAGEGDVGLLPEEERQALLSTLQELTVAALQLFDPAAPLDAFMLRLTERLRANAILCLELADPSGMRVEVVGAGGLSRSSLKLPLAPSQQPPSTAPHWALALRLPYPELEGSSTLRWLIPLHPVHEREPDGALLIFYDARPPFAEQLRGMVGRLAGVLQAALAHRRLHARLAEQMTLMRAQADASVEGILLLSPDMKVLSHNRRFLAMWGFAELPLGTSVTPALNSAAELVAAPEEFLARVAYLMEHPELETTDELALRDGRTLERYSAPIHRPDGTLVGRGWFFRDVTDRKLAEQERALLLEHEREARFAAEEAVRLRDDFLSAAAHELKTPLTPLSLRLASVERLAQEGRVDLLLVQKARASLRRLTALIADLLDLSRVQGGRLKLDLHPIRLNELVHKAADDFQLVSPHHRLVVDDRAELLVRADPQRFEQVLTNLLENAVKYSPSGGAIRLRLAPRGPEAVLSVTDEGIGIPREEQPLVFDRFFRARNAPVTKFGGMGLGLYISRTIVERHGGRIWVESELGKGATFHVALPRLSHQAASAEGPAARH